MTHRLDKIHGLLKYFNSIIHIPSVVQVFNQFFVTTWTLILRQTLSNTHVMLASLFNISDQPTYTNLNVTQVS